MDREAAAWLAEMILETASYLEDSPGLTIEVEGKVSQWVQVLPEEDEEDAETVGGFVVNFPYREHSGDPLAALAAAGLKAPPDTRTLEWEDDGFASIWIRPDVPLVAFVLFIGDILTRIVGAAADSEIAVHIEYGY